MKSVEKCGVDENDLRDLQGARDESHYVRNC